MRVGFLTNLNLERLDWAQAHGFGSIAWVGLENSPCGPQVTEWQRPAEEFFAAAQARGIRISAIGALYANPLDPAQREWAGRAFQRGIEVAAHLGVKTVAGFSGAPIHLRDQPWGGNQVYEPFEEHVGEFRAFWEPLARYAAERNVRIAFENCATGPFHLPVMNFNMMARPALWEIIFNEMQLPNIGLEWDPSHLLCQLIDPVANIRKFGSRIFHVHAKDAWIDQARLAEYGICHEGVAEHRMPGLGAANWAQIVHALCRVGYDSDLNIEGWHDPVYRDAEGRKLEEAGLIVARKTLEIYTQGTE
jgi:sugar phosphate isomerase/epimerase